ncbi:DNA methylase [Mycobacterium phage Makemake]|uniref:DNA methyltransferase n=1 Tax=Mycobacterium phage Makemake TaxID=1873889 RepID=UPI00080F20CE|nr:DNA methyltransferase [Mycobacterium phage Makemake]ANT41833.1 DNA methylase [Mycobacterium phage Makemake]
MSNVDLRLGDCRDILTELEDASVDSIVTDPPYELAFMGKKWDSSGIAFDVEMWEQCLRVLKPGGHLLAFGGSRTWHRLTVAIEDAGFEIRDSIAWLYGSGFPKSLDVSKAIDKAAGAEREVIGEQPDRWTNKGTVLNFATDRPQSSIPVTGDPATEAARQWQGWGTALKPAFEPIVVARKPLAGTVAANVLEHGTGALNIAACRVGDGPDSQSGRWPTNVVLDDAQAAELGEPQKFFPVFKYQAKAPTKERPSYVNEDGAKVAHPTVKPVALMRWIAKLSTPPGGVVLDPFAGSGATAEACILEGFKCIAIEKEPDYIPLIEQRRVRAVSAT